MPDDVSRLSGRLSLAIRPALDLSREVNWYHSGQSKLLSPSLIMNFYSYIRKTATAVHSCLICR